MQKPLSPCAAQCYVYCVSCDARIIHSCRTICRDDFWRSVVADDADASDTSSGRLLTDTGPSTRMDLYLARKNTVDVWLGADCNYSDCSWNLRGSVIWSGRVSCGRLCP